MGHHFDICVIGMQRAGLIAASLLAKRGARVLLVDHGESSASYHHNGIKLPLVPNLIPVLDDAPHVRQVIAELGLAPDLKPKSRVLNPAFQTILPGHRINMYSDRNRVVDELSAAFPELASVIYQFFERLFFLDERLTEFLANDPPLPALGTIADNLRARTAKSRMARLYATFEGHSLFAGIPKQHPLRDILLGPLVFFGHLSTSEPTGFHAVRLLGRYFNGSVDFEDSQGGMDAMLLRAAVQSGVEIKHGAIVDSLDLVGRYIKGFNIEDDNGTYTADFVVANTYSPFHRLIPTGKQHTKYRQEQENLRVSGHLLVMNFVVRKEVLPEPMAEAVFLLNGRRLSREDRNADPPMFIRRFGGEQTKKVAGCGKDYGTKKPADTEILSVACPASPDDVLSPDRLASLKRLMFERTRRLIPHLENYLCATSMPMDTAAWDMDTDRRRIDPASLHPLFESNDAPRFGIAGRTPLTFLKNVMHSGVDVLPGLGFEGDYVTGLAIAKSLGKLGDGSWRAKR